jgi:DnaJ-class molecular chaperone
MPTLYDTLEIRPDASPEVIAASHRALARRYHPDNKATASPKQFRAVQEAFETLKDAGKRQEYDAYIERESVAAATEQDHRPMPGPPFEQVLVNAGAEMLKHHLGHIPGISDLVDYYQKPARDAIRQGVGSAATTLRSRRSRRAG